MNIALPPWLTKVAEADFPTQFGLFRIFGFEGGPSGGRAEEALALKMGDITGGAPPLVRIHSECLTGDVFHSLRCDCRAQLEIALNRIAVEGRGLLIYEHKDHVYQHQNVSHRYQIEETNHYHHKWHIVY